MAEGCSFTIRGRRWAAGEMLEVVMSSFRKSGGLRVKGSGRELNMHSGDWQVWIRVDTRCH